MYERGYVSGYLLGSGSACSTWHLCQIAERPARERVDLHVLDQSIDTSDATGRLLFQMPQPLRSLRREPRVLNGNARGFSKPKSGSSSTLVGRRNYFATVHFFPAKW